MVTVWGSSPSAGCAAAVVADGCRYSGAFVGGGAVAAGVSLATGFAVLLVADGCGVPNTSVGRGVAVASAEGCSTCSMAGRLADGPVQPATTTMTRVTNRNAIGVVPCWSTGNLTSGKKQEQTHACPRFEASRGRTRKRRGQARRKAPCLHDALKTGGAAGATRPASAGQAGRGRHSYQPAGRVRPCPGPAFAGLGPGYALQDVLRIHRRLGFMASHRKAAPANSTVAPHGALHLEVTWDAMSPIKSSDRRTSSKAKRRPSPGGACDFDW